MGCFCYAKVIDSGGDPRVIQMSFTNIDSEDDTKYCSIWALAYGIQLSVTYGTPAIIALINIIVSELFKYISPFGRFYTKNDQTNSTFKSLTILQFINVGIILLVQSLKFNIPFLN